MNAYVIDYQGRLIHQSHPIKFSVEKTQSLDQISGLRSGGYLLRLEGDQMTRCHSLQSVSQALDCVKIGHRSCILDNFGGLLSFNIFQKIRLSIQRQTYSKPERVEWGLTFLFNAFINEKGYE